MVPHSRYLGAFTNKLLQQFLELHLQTGTTSSGSCYRNNIGCFLVSVCRQVVLWMNQKFQLLIAKCSPIAEYGPIHTMSSGPLQTRLRFDFATMGQDCAVAGRHISREDVLLTVAGCLSTGCPIPSRPSLQPPAAPTGGYPPPPPLSEVGFAMTSLRSPIEAKCSFHQGLFQADDGK